MRSGRPTHFRASLAKREARLCHRSSEKSRPYSGTGQASGLSNASVAIAWNRSAICIRGVQSYKLNADCHVRRMA